MYIESIILFQVGWLRASDQTVLALQGRVVTHNARISVMHEDMHTWKLKISKLRESDRGCYMCQINTSPMKKQVGCIDVQGECIHTNHVKLYLSYNHFHSSSRHHQ